jgi:hypothetical protein
LDGALIARSVGDDRLSCHRVTQAAVLNAMNAQRKYEVFHHALLLLNAAFPTQSDGIPLLE